MSPWPYLSRSYICILPSSLTRILPCAFAFSARPPVSVYGTVPRRLKLRKSFSARRLLALPLPVGRVPPGSPPSTHLTVDIIGSPLRPGLPSPGCDSPYASFHRICGRHGNVDPFPIGYDLRPRLIYPGNLRLPADRNPTCLFVTHACILSSIPSSTAHAAPSSVHGMLPYPQRLALCRSFGGVLSPVELSAHDYSTSELLRTL